MFRWGRENCEFFHMVDTYETPDILPLYRYRFQGIPAHYSQSWFLEHWHILNNRFQQRLNKTLNGNIRTRQQQSFIILIQLSFKAHNTLYFPLSHFVAEDLAFGVHPDTYLESVPFLHPVLEAKRIIYNY